jgi:hypothetical protein
MNSEPGSYPVHAVHTVHRSAPRFLHRHFEQISFNITIFPVWEIFLTHLAS